MIFRTLAKITSVALLTYFLLSLGGGIGLVEIGLRRFTNPVGTQGRRQASAVAVAARARVEDVSVAAADGIRLTGWLFTPAVPNGDTVVLLHAVGTNRAFSSALAGLFLSHGYRAVTPDARGHGDSGGTVPTFGALEADDVRRWVQWAAAGAPAGCVYLMGVSMGGGHALQASAAPELCGVIAESGFVSLREVTFDRVGQAFGVGDWLGRIVLRPAVETAFVYGRLRDGIDYGGASALTTVAGAGAPILLIHGTDDRNVPVRHAQMVQARNPRRIMLWTVPGAGHADVWGTAGDAYAPRLIGFLERNRLTARAMIGR